MSTPPPPPQLPPLPTSHPSRSSLSLYEEISLELDNTTNTAPIHPKTPPPRRPRGVSVPPILTAVTVLQYPPKEPPVLVSHPGRKGSTGSVSSSSTVVAEEAVGAGKAGCWYKPSTWSRLTWIRLWFFLGLPTLSFSWFVSLIYFFLWPQCMAAVRSPTSATASNRFKSTAGSHVPQRVRDDLEKAAGEREAAMELEEKKMSFWLILTAVFWLAWWVGWVIVGAVWVFTGTTYKLG